MGIWRIFIWEFGAFSFGNLAHFHLGIWRIFVGESFCCLVDSIGVQTNDNAITHHRAKASSLLYPRSYRALIQLVTPSEVAIAVRIAAMVWIMNFQVSRFFMLFGKVLRFLGYIVVWFVVGVCCCCCWLLSSRRTNQITFPISESRESLLTLPSVGNEGEAN